MEDLLITVLLTQFFVGAFQLLMALIRSFTSMWKFSDGCFSLKYYWILVAVYFLGGGAVLMAFEFGIMRSNAEWFGLTYLLSAWLLAGYYWVLLYRYLQANAPLESPDAV